MQKLIEKTLKAKRESKFIEFKAQFDPSSTREWCEIIKDIVAISNSGGGAILFGVDNIGTPLHANLSALIDLDPADITNRLSKYIGISELGICVSEVSKGREKLVLFVIEESEVPLVFNKPGTYSDGPKKQKTAFSQGTVYFRHGAKSEPGNTQDLRRALIIRVERIRKELMKGVSKVVKAPQGTQVVLMPPHPKRIDGKTTIMPVKAVADPSATPVLLTRDKSKASGIYMHEEVDERLFDEINNVIEVNSLLASRKKEFVLGQSVYYRIYANRLHVQQSGQVYSEFLLNALTKQNVPYMYWCVHLPGSRIARALVQQYRNPKSPYIRSMLRAAICLGDEFTDWLFQRMHDKWEKHTQPPSYYYTFKKMISQRNRKDYRLIAISQSKDTQITIREGDQVKLEVLLEDPNQASEILSKKCMEVHDGNRELGAFTRELDILAYGSILRKKSIQISKEMVKLIGDALPGDPPDDLDS